MVAIGISEFTFGFAFLYELTKANWGDIKAAPILPSLQQEQNQGWDAQLPVTGTPFFYQFKLAEYLFNPNAKLISDGTYDAPYFRVSLHRRENNRQHRLLWTLAQQNPETFYVAPEMTTRDQFNDAFLQERILPNSRSIRVSECDQLLDTDGEQHIITFQPENSEWVFRSKPRHRSESFRGEEIRRSYELTRQRWKPISPHFAQELLEQAVESVRRLEDIDREQVIVAQRHLMEAPAAGLPRETVLKRVSDITATVFGATMVLVGSRPNPNAGA